MSSSFFKVLVASLILFALSACIGTDLVDEPLAPGPDQAEITQGNLALQIGETSQLDFRLIGGDGQEKNTTWNWSSRDLSVAEVNGTGLVTARGVGQTWVDGRTTAGPRDSVLVTVVADPNAVADVEITGDRNNLMPGDTLSLSAQVRNANGDLLTNQNISWISDNPPVASVSDQGLVTALSEGEVNITAEAAGISSLPFAISVQIPSMMRMGSFSGQNGYSASGKVILNEESTGATVDFDSNFATQNGPGLYVYLSPNQTNVSGGLSLGALQSTSGSQSYTVPASADLAAYDFVVIYCQPFGVPFGAASLQ